MGSGTSTETREVDSARGALAERRENFATDAFEAERERFFLWSPVCLGLGIAAYFAMPTEPQHIVAVVPVVTALILRGASTRGTISAALFNALIIAGAGFALAKARVEAVRAPVLAEGPAQRRPQRCRDYGRSEISEGTEADDLVAANRRPGAGEDAGLRACAHDVVQVCSGARRPYPPQGGGVVAAGETAVARRVRLRANRVVRSGRRRRIRLRGTVDRWSCRRRQAR